MAPSTTSSTAEQSALLARRLHYNHNPEQPQQTMPRGSYQHYDSLCYSTTTDGSTLTSSDSDTFLVEHSSLNIDGNYSHHHNNHSESQYYYDDVHSSNRQKAKRLGRTAKRVGLIFGIAVLCGLVMWIGTYSLEHNARRHHHGRHRSNNVEEDEIEGMSLLGRGLSLWGNTNNDDDSTNDDDNAQYYQTSTSFVDLLPIPLLGRSRAYKAQEEADHAHDFLYLDPAKKAASRYEHRREHEGKLKPIESLLGRTSARGFEVKEDEMIHAHDGCEGTIMIMRHCEKGSIREHCNYLGYERSVYLASLFGHGPEYRWPEPSYLVAENPGDRRNPKKKNFREVETILPLGDKFNLTVDDSYSTLDTNKLARKIQGMLRSGELCGKLMVISWKHSKIPKLAHALACGPREGCPWHYRGKRFDELWQIKVCL